MPSHHQFTPTQLKWLQQQQLLTDAEMNCVENQPDAQDKIALHQNLAYAFQGKLYAKAHDLKIP
ncbi:hypothetical protein PtB15_8B132 [Puccinia triticina]|nr:hypothetical protein PtB15_8B132 [Puccinia triticina]